MVDWRFPPTPYAKENHTKEGKEDHKEDCSKRKGSKKDEEEGGEEGEESGKEGGEKGEEGGKGKESGAKIREEVCAKNPKNAPRSR